MTNEQLLTEIDKYLNERNIETRLYLVGCNPDLAHNKAFIVITNPHFGQFSYILELNQATLTLKPAGIEFESTRKYTTHHDLCDPNCFEQIIKLTQARQRCK